MSITTSKTVLITLLVVWALTLGRSLIIMMCGKKIFIKASKGAKTALYPLINLFTMLEVAEISTYLGILLFIPFINIIILILMSMKIGKVFNTGTFFTIGLVILPFMFYPLLAISDKQYKVSDEAYFKQMDNAKEENINLMTENEIKEMNDTPVEEEKVDSIFKSDIELKAAENSAPYKATKIDLLGSEKLKDASEEDDLFEPINRVPEEKEKKHKDKDDVEMMDL